MTIGSPLLSVVRETWVLLEISWTPWDHPKKSSCQAGVVALTYMPFGGHSVHRVEDDV